MSTNSLAIIIDNVKLVYNYIKKDNTENSTINA